MKPVLAAALIRHGGACLEVRWSDGTHAEFADLWLRDSLPQDRDAHSGQRLVDIVDVPEACSLRSVALQADTVKVGWSDETPETCFPGGWLYQQARRRPPAAAPGPSPWLEGARLDARRDFASHPLAALSSGPGLRREWLRRLLRDGIAFLTGVPATETGILEAIRHVGRVAETNYGRVFDVRTVPQPENLAYSDLGLGLHTDNPYREPVPGFQALHALVAAPDGGESLFADGFALADLLRGEDPGAFALLTGTPVPFHYRSESAELFASRPLIALDCTGAVSAVHYNSRSIAPLPLPPEECRAFYRAYRSFARLLRDARYQLKTQLRDGELVVFDNQRILHGRTAFASARHARHLRGCYLTRDSVYSEHALLDRNRPEDFPT